MRTFARPLALASGLLAFAVAVSAAPASAAVSTASKGPYFVGGYVPSTTVVPAKLRSSAADELPESVDLRAKAPAVGNQGSIGACVAWTIGYSIMGYYANVNGGTGAPYAPLYLYMKAVNGAPPNAGLVPQTALSVAAKTGVDTQSDYFQGTTDYSVKPTAAEDANASSYKITGWSTLWSGTVNQGTAGKLLIEKALASGSPVAIGFPVFADFQRLKGNTVYNTLSGSSLGGHMVAVYGYDSKGIWIRNSWTSAWGNNGDAELSWDFVNKQVSSAFTVSGITTPAIQKTPAPAVVALTTKTGSTTGGGTVTITGSNLTSATAVKFGDVAAGFTVNGNQLVATAPAHAAGVVDVTVTTPGGTSTASAATKFTYVAPAPAVTKVEPATSVIFGGGTITLTGSGFTGAKSVRIGSTTATNVKVVSDTQLTFVAPRTTAAGVQHVTVTNGTGTSKTVTVDVLTYLNPPAPRVTALSVSSGKTTATTSTTLTGTNLTGATAVTVGGVRTTFTAVSDTQLNVVLPRHAAGSANVQVTTPGGTSAAGDVNKFTWVAP
jgi:hypothetical protein